MRLYQTADSGAAVKVLASHNVKRPTTSGRGIGKDIDTYYVEVLANTAPDGVGGTYSLGLQMFMTFKQYTTTLQVLLIQQAQM